MKETGITPDEPDVLDANYAPEKHASCQVRSIHKYWNVMAHRFDSYELPTRVGGSLCLNDVSPEREVLVREWKAPKSDG
jgi:hypothetical protein